MKRFALVTVFLLSVLFINPNSAFSQNLITDTSGQADAMRNATNIYRQFLFPETGLYNGGEYAYNAYYTFQINEGHPFFMSKDFDTGSVFYNNILYEKVPLLFDIIKEELLIQDPSRLYIIKLHNENIGWFTIWDHTFIKLIHDSTADASMHTGFYDLLYRGNVVLYKKVSKTINENTASAQGVNAYVVQTDEYFIKKDNQYYRIKNKKSLMPVFTNKKKEIQQFIRKNTLNFKKDMEDALKKIVAYYDIINNSGSQSH